MTSLHKGDCLEVMDQLIADGVIVDSIICDPPYGTTACKWDAIIPLDKMWERLHKLIKPDGAIILFGSEPFSSTLRMSNIKSYKYDWKWEKPNGANFLNFKYQPAKVHEDIMVFGKKATSYSKRGNLAYFPQMEMGAPYTQKSGKQKTDNANTSVRSKIKQTVTQNKGERYPRSIQKFTKDKGSTHPTQKPEKLMAFLVKTYTNENETVLDFTMGSGTTGAACKKTNRNFIGIEIDEEFFTTAQKRIDNIK